MPQAGSRVKGLYARTVNLFIPRICGGTLFFFIWTFPGLRITLTPGAGTFTGFLCHFKSMLTPVCNYIIKLPGKLYRTSTYLLFTVVDYIKTDDKYIGYVYVTT